VPSFRKLQSRNSEIAEVQNLEFNWSDNTNLSFTVVEKVNWGPRSVLRCIFYVLNR